jgi:hypothetical protein
MIARAGRLGVALLLLATVCLVARESHAGAEMLKHGIENATQGPLDGLLTPVVAGITTYRNVSEESPSSTAAAVGTGFIVYTGYLMFEGSSSWFRTWAGLMEIPVGLAVLAASPFTDWQPDRFFDDDKPSALVDHPMSWFHVKFGIYHVGGRD